MAKNEGEGSMRNELLQFFIGVILLGAGLFIFSKRVVVTSGWYIWSMWGVGVPTGLTVVPLLIGVIWLFINKKSIPAKVITILGAVFILATIIMSITMYFIPTSLNDYILILAMIAAGSGLLLKTLFKPRNEKEEK